MPWQGNAGKGAPWGNPGLSLEEVLKQAKNILGPRFSGIFIILFAIVALWCLSCFYTIQPGEVGVIQRFGRFARLSSPGLNLKLPVGLESLTKLRVQYVYTEEFGIRTIQAGIDTEYSSSKQYLDESLMLTGDLNCAVVPWIVQFRIGDPYNFLFKVRDVKKTLRDISEAVMRQVVGDRSVNDVITERLEIATTVKTELQKAVNDAETGITIVNVELKRTTVPDPVQPSFNEVNQSLQEKERMIYEAREAYNKVIPEASGEAQRILRESEGYALERINQAKGDTARFLSVWTEYNSAKDVTRRRLYLEAMRDVVPKLGKTYIIDPEKGGLLPLLNLGEKQEEEKKP
ncbi:MAG: FtsH protease activity modulator HflK [Proteobacteria bacterium]|nr:FtsH protease activity modulator HflK [Pseudomonadota bacterium]